MYDEVPKSADFDLLLTFQGLFYDFKYSFHDFRRFFRPQADFPTNTDLEDRLNQHKAMLFYRESFDDKHSAAKRERAIKGRTRDKKLKLIESYR